jgi:hypothetical protein
LPDRRAEIVEAPPAMTAVPAVSEPVERPTNPVPPPAVDSHAMDTRAVRRVLQQYEDSYDRLDARAAAAIWRGLNASELARAFATLSSQDLTFERCDVSLVAQHATATCRGLLRYVPRVGDPSPRRQVLTWTIALARADEAWLIERVAVR